MQIDGLAAVVTGGGSGMGAATARALVAAGARVTVIDRDGDRAAAVAKHLADFWEPRMRRQLFAHVEAGGAGLDPLVIEAARRLSVKT